MVDVKFKYEDFTISLNELRELILSYAERKRKYKPKSGIRFTIEDIRKVINRKRKGLSQLPTTLKGRGLH